MTKKYCVQKEKKTKYTGKIRKKHRTFYKKTKKNWFKKYY